MYVCILPTNKLYTWWHTPVLLAATMFVTKKALQGGTICLNGIVNCT
jgi:hypothetical protein